MGSRVFDHTGELAEGGRGCLRGLCLDSGVCQSQWGQELAGRVSDRQCFVMKSTGLISGSLSVEEKLWLFRSSSVTGEV